MDPADEVVDQVRDARRSPVGRGLARVGLGSRAVVYFALAALVVQLGFGTRPDDTDQAGALQAVGEQPAGVVVLWLLVVGVACYALWRFSEVVAGTASGDDGVLDRAKSAIEGAVYIPIAVTAATIAVGGRSEQGDRYRSLSATVMQDWPGGRWWVGLVGVVLLGAGGFLASEGVRRSFREDFGFEGNRRAERTVVVLGTVGCTARGVVIALAGVLVISAAVTSDPDKAGGIDAALRAVADQPFGPYLLLVVAAGLASYALFALGESVWGKV